MRTSTMKDIVENLPIIQKHALRIMRDNPSSIDDWEGVSIGDMEFDINVYRWEEDGREVLNTCVHPVAFKEDGYGEADFSTFYRLYQKDIITGNITERKQGND